MATKKEERPPPPYIKYIEKILNYQVSEKLFFKLGHYVFVYCLQLGCYFFRSSINYVISYGLGHTDGFFHCHWCTNKSKIL